MNTYLQNIQNIIQNLSPESGIILMYSRESAEREIKIMAMAKAICKCKTCGNEFAVTKKCYNRSDADNYEEWAKEHYDECTECYIARRKAETAEKAAKIIAENHLPEISGVSAKQVDYANALRNRYLVEHDDRIPLLLKMLAIEGTPKYIEAIKKCADEKFGGDMKAAENSKFEHYGVDILRKLWKTGDAHEIIEAIR